MFGRAFLAFRRSPIFEVYIYIVAHVILRCFDHALCTYIFTRHRLGAVERLGTVEKWVTTDNIDF